MNENAHKSAASDGKKTKYIHCFPEVVDDDYGAGGTVCIEKIKYTTRRRGEYLLTTRAINVIDIQHSQSEALGFRLSQSG